MLFVSPSVRLFMKRLIDDDDDIMKVASQTLDRMVYLRADRGEPWSFIFIITVLLIVMFLPCSYKKIMMELSLVVA